VPRREARGARLIDAFLKRRQGVRGCCTHAVAPGSRIFARWRQAPARSSGTREGCVSRTSAASALARAKRDPGPRATSAKRVMASHQPRSRRRIVPPTPRFRPSRSARSQA
jgi:hypothetical protein